MPDNKHTKIPDIKQLIDQLLKIPSISCTSPEIDQGNIHIINLLADWFESLGFHCVIQALEHDENKANLIATLGHGNNGLVLAGHTDTVPLDEALWQVDPFKATEKNDRFYGLGSCDMKSFFAIIIEALKSIDLKKINQPLIILATADEETSMSGAKAIAKHANSLGINNARFAVIGEPTDMQPVRMHKGMMMEAIQLVGQAGHSSDPALGNNALEAMHKVISELLNWRDELQSKYTNPLFEVPVPTMNLGHIHGGDNPNRICGSCELQIDIRPLPGMKLSDLRSEMQRRLNRVLQETGIQLKTIPLTDGFEAMDTDRHSEIVQLAEKMTNTESQVVAFGTEAPYYNGIGLETIVMGPGNIKQAHQPDEYIEMKSLMPATDIIRKLIFHYCL
ncbi:MAG TPA: acetylornithine deacetylase [Gammaproteobacteria bacterium]|nr:acetylornithine deacetylase [Gammaproteobacteria bacterium]